MTIFPSSIAKILSKIPTDVWNKIVMEEPEFKLGDQLERYRFGKFSTLMIAVGLNDYQLKGPAEKVYWPRIHEIIRNKPVPKTTKELEELLVPFYKSERLHKAKIKRLQKFLNSCLAYYLWDSAPSEVSRDFKWVWKQLAITMGQKKTDKTIVFAMKALGIALILASRWDFDFAEIPIPVDSRIRRITEGLTGNNNLRDQEIRYFWSTVLKEVQKSVPSITMIHLDSLIWQIGNKECSEIQRYFERFSLPEVGEKFCNLLTQRSNLWI